MFLLKGLYDGIKAILIALLCNKLIYRNYLDLVLFHTLGILVIKIIYFPSFMITYSYYIDYLLLLFWKLPIYLIGIFINNYKVSLIVNDLHGVEKIKSDYNYNNFSKYLANLIYYNLVILILTIIPKIFIFFNYYYYFDILFTSFLYSIYCWEYNWNFNKIPYLTRYQLIMDNYYYLIGYGLIFGFTKLVNNFFIQFHIISIIFPLNTIYTFKCKELIKYNKNNLSFFKIPIQLTNFLLRIIRWMH